jgi:hypothetical protein
MNPRPLKTEEQKQTARLEFKCTEKEKEEIIALSEAHGFHQYSTFVRLASLGKLPVDRNKIASNEQRLEEVKKRIEELRAMRK